jgi:hypothetical protein
LIQISLPVKFSGKNAQRFSSKRSENILQEQCQAYYLYKNRASYKKEKKEEKTSSNMTKRKRNEERFKQL